MRSITLKAPAKINLGLSILGKLPNGYHEVKTIYTQVSLFDILKIEEAKEDKVDIYCDDKNIPTGRENLAYQAAELIKKQTKTKKGIKIFIKKTIPVGSGLGGGSSDAAIVLKELNQLWQLNLPLIQLIKLAKTIGADVAYHLVGGTQLEVQGGKKAGEFISLGKLPKCFILLCIPDIKIKSKAAYAQIEYDKIGQNNLASLIKAIKKQEIEGIAKNLHNDFEIWTFEKYPFIKEIKRGMLKHGALGSLMIGKGSAVFGIFNNLNQTKLAQEFFVQDSLKTFLVKPL